MRPWFPILFFVLLMPQPASASTPSASGSSELTVVRTWGDRSQTTCLATHGDDLWVGTLGGGVVRLRGDETMVVDAARGLPGNRVHDCLWHEGSLWVAAEGGLARIDESLRVEVVEQGRFVRLAKGGPLLAAASARPALHFVGLDRRMGLEVTPSALALHASGAWAVGSIDGRMRIVGSDGTERVVALDAPIESITALDDGGYRVVTALHRWRVGADGTRRLLRGSSALRVMEAAAEVDTASLAPLHVRAVARWRGRPTVATSDGAYVLRSGRFERLDLGGTPCGDRIASLEVFGDALWAGSFDRGLCRFDGTEWQRFSGMPYLPSDMVHDMTASADHLWIATHQGLSTLSADGAFEVRTVEDCRDTGRRDCPWHTTVNGVTTDSRTGKVWMADVGAVHRIDGARWRGFYRKAGIRSPRLTRIAAWFGHVAVGTGDSGVLILGKGRRFVPFDDQRGPSDNWITDLAYDDKGRLWVASCTRGLSRLAAGRWRTFTAEDGLADDYVLSVHPQGRKVWVGTLKGLSVLTPRRGGRYHMRTLDRSTGLGGDEVHDVVHWRGRAWVATDGGVAELAGSSI